MYKAFPCSDYYGGSVAISDIQRHNLIATPVAFRLRQSPFRHIVTISAIDYRMRCSSFTAYCSSAVVCFRYTAT